jgi:hypothetical protein
MTYLEEQALLKRTIDGFPDEFTLYNCHRAYRVDKLRSYVSTDGSVQIVIDIQMPSGEWVNYARTNAKDLFPKPIKRRLTCAANELK